jgi:hypothetical protein
MNYQSGLKALRAKLIEKSTGAPAPQEKSLESFISSRSQNQMPQETPEDLMSKSANWMSEIKKATIEFKKAQEAVRSVRPAPNPFAAATEGFLDQRKAKKAEKKEDEEEGFIKPREQDSDRRAGAHENAIATVRNTPPSIEPVKGYGEISQDTMEQIIKAEAEARNINPETAIAIFRSEGAGAYQSQVPREGKGSYNGLEDSYGPFQLYRGGGLGNEYEKLTGRNLRNDNTIEGITTQIRFALDRAVSQGWQPWYGRETAGVGVRDGLKNAKAIGNWK